MARTMMIMQRRWTTTSCMVLLLVALALQLRDSSALQDANEILIRTVADEQQKLRDMSDLREIDEVFGEEKMEELRVGVPYTIIVGSNIISGTGSGDGVRAFHGTGVAGIGTTRGGLLDNGRLYNETHSFELTAPNPPYGARVQTILFTNWAGQTVGVWSGTFPTNLPASAGPGWFIHP